jgi:hypothetical protein
MMYPIKNPDCNNRIPEGEINYVLPDFHNNLMKVAKIVIKMIYMDFCFH